MTTEIGRQLLRREEAAASLGMSLRHFQRHVQPNLPVVYSGALRLYPVEGLRAWIDAQAVKSGR